MCSQRVSIIRNQSCSLRFSGFVLLADGTMFPLLPRCHICDRHITSALALWPRCHLVSECYVLVGDFGATDVAPQTLTATLRIDQLPPAPLPPAITFFFVCSCISAHTSEVFVGQRGKKFLKKKETERTRVRAEEGRKCNEVSQRRVKLLSVTRSSVRQLEKPACCTSETEILGPMSWSLCAFAWGTVLLYCVC